MTAPRTSSTEPRRTTDPRVALRTALDSARAVIADVPPSSWGRRTPCDEMDVRALLGHLLAVVHRIAAVGRGEPFAVPDTIDPVGDAMSAPADSPVDEGTRGADGAGRWVAAWDRATAEVEQDWGDDELLHRELDLPWEDAVRGDRILGIYTNEVVVHTWDLAVATGQQPAWDDDVVHHALDAISAEVPAVGRDAMWEAVAAEIPAEMGPFVPPFGPAVDVPATAPLTDRLVAWNGRDPRWRPVR